MERRRAKEAVSQDEARREAQRVLDLAKQVEYQRPKEDGDDASFASNISVSFASGNSDTEMSIEGEEAAPDHVKDMLKNAVKGQYDPKAWENI